MVSNVPFASIFSCFVTRAYDFIRLAAISNLNVKLVGDLARGSHADTHGLESMVVNVGRNDHPPPRHFLANQFGGDAFATGNVFHFAGYDSVAGVMDLSPNRVVPTRSNPL